MQQQQKLQQLLNVEPKTPEQIKLILQSIKKNSLNMTDAVFEFSYALLSKFRKHISNQEPLYLDLYTNSALQLKVPAAQSGFKKLKKKFESTSFLKKLNALYMYLASPQNITYVKNIYEFLIKEDLSDYQTKKRKIALLKFENKIQQFVEALNLFLEQNPNDTQTWQQLGMIYIQYLNLHKATFCYEELIILNPRNDHYYVKLGQIYMSLGGSQNLKNAKDYFCYIVGRDQNNYRALWCLNRTCKYLIPQYEKSDNANVKQIKALHQTSTEALKIFYKKSKNISLNKFRF